MASLIQFLSWSLLKGYHQQRDWHCKLTAGESVMYICITVTPHYHRCKFTPHQNHIINNKIKTVQQFNDVRMHILLLLSHVSADNNSHPQEDC